MLVTFPPYTVPKADTKPTCQTTCQKSFKQVFNTTVLCVQKSNIAASYWDCSPLSSEGNLKCVCKFKENWENWSWNVDTLLINNLFRLFFCPEKSVVAGSSSHRMAANNERSNVGDAYCLYGLFCAVLNIGTVSTCSHLMTRSCLIYPFPLFPLEMASGLEPTSP